MLTNREENAEASAVIEAVQQGRPGSGQGFSGSSTAPALPFEFQDSPNKSHQLSVVQSGRQGVQAEGGRPVGFPAPLAAQEVRLQPSEKWLTQPNKLLFVFPIRGRGQYVSRSTIHRLSPGDVLILNPTRDGEIAANHVGEFVFRFFVAGTEDIIPLFGNREISQLQNVLEGLKATRLHGFATPLAKESHALLAGASPQLNLAHRAQLLRVVAALLGGEFSTVQPHLPGFVHAEDHLMQVLGGLTTEELVRLSVGKLAVRFGCSKRHLSRLFHRHFGFSVAAMKMEIRLMKAVSMLRDPNVKVIHVAAHCGFNCLGLFNACFKRRLGVTPSALRKMMAEARRQSDPCLPGTFCPMQSRGLCVHPGNPDHQPPAKAGVSEIPGAGSAKIVIAAKSSRSDQHFKRVDTQQAAGTIPECPALPPPRLTLRAHLHRT